MGSTAKALMFAVRPRMILKYLGLLFVVASVLTAVPLVVSLLFQDFSISLRYAFVVTVLALTGASLYRLNVSSHIQKNEAMIVVTLVFVTLPLVMVVPMMGSGLTALDALFESMSAATTTGLSTVTTLSDKPNTFLFARAWMQWYGGLGIVILSVAFILQPGLVTRRLAITEDDDDGLIGGMRAYARRVLAIYAVMTALGMIALTALGTRPFHAILFTLAGVSTGGFSPTDMSLSGLPNIASQAVLTMVCVAGATSFVFYIKFSRLGLSGVLKDAQLRAVVLLGFCSSLIYVLVMRLSEGTDWATSIRHGLLMIFSAQTTAGFSTTPVADLPAAAKLLLILSMSIGGGAGSTAGGFKVLRLLIAVRLLQTLLTKACLPSHAILEPKLAGRRLGSSEIQNALILILVFIGVVIMSWLPFLICGYDPLDALFEVVSAIGTAGLSAGITGPGLPAFLKVVLCLDMLLGRLEIVPVLVLVFPGTWIGRRRNWL